jgi:hypothetical protein
MSKTEFDFDAILEILAKASEREPEEIRAEIEGLVAKFDYSLPGAVAVWKSEHQFDFNTGKQTYVARCMAKENPREATTRGGPSMVGNVHFAFRNPETGEIEFRNAGSWGKERIDVLYAAFDVGKAYKFDAGLNRKGQFTRISGWTLKDKEGNTLEKHEIEEVEDPMAPSIEEIPPMPVSRLADKINQYEYVRGWVGEILKSQGSGEFMGFELNDNFSLLPANVWVGGKYAKMSPEAIQAVAQGIRKNIEVGAYGYVSGGGGATKADLNASSVFFFE